MKNLIYLISILLLIACNKPKPRIAVVEEENLTQTQIDSILDEYNFQYSELTFIDSTSQVLLPITTQKQNNRKRYSSYEDEGYPRYWNILFYDSETQKTNLLTESKFRIANFRANIINSGPILENKILYEIGDTDYNNDGRYNYKDPLHLFVSETNGRELLRLSPLNEDLEMYQIIPNTDKIIFRTIRDVDKDLDFDKEDEIIWYQIDLSKKDAAFEIIKPSDRKLIENLYFQQWLLKNNKS